MYTTCVYLSTMPVYRLHSYNSTSKLMPYAAVLHFTVTSQFVF